MPYKVVRWEQTGFTPEFIAGFIRRSFEERVAQGFVFTCSSTTAQSFANEAKRKNFYIAVDEQTGSMAGIMSVYYRITPHRKTKCASVGNLAIAPEVKRSGIGTLLFETIQKDCTDCVFIESDTAMGAKSSVNWHLKNGFKIVGLRSFRSTAYYSYYFRKQLVHPSKWDLGLFCQIRLAGSSILTVCKYKANGQPRLIKRIFE